MIAEHVSKCIDFLNKRFIKVQTEWCDACLEWLSEENNGLPNLSELTNLVYEQWLLGDLREIAAPSFPSEIKGRKGTHIVQGNYCVQVHNVIDIGHSAYSQLSKIRGNEIDIGDDDEDDNLKQFFKGNTTKKDDKKSMQSSSKWQKETFSRMLFLELHDGHQAIEAIEYKSFSHLSIENITPGIKVLLTGPLTTRDGMFFLKGNNIKLLGGSVEDLVDSSSQINSLCELLQIDGEEKAKMCKETAIPKESASTNATLNTTLPNGNVEKNKNQMAEELDGINEDLFINDVFDDIDIDDKALSQEIDENVLITGKHLTNSKNIVNEFKQNEKNYSKNNISTCALQKSNTKTNEINIDSPKVLNRDPIKEEIDDVIDADIFFGDDDFDIKTPQSSVPRKSRTADATREKTVVLKQEDRSELKTEMSLSELIERDEPFEGIVTLRLAWFTTLTSTLKYDPQYRLTAIVTNGQEFLEVLLGNEALCELVGFPSSQVTDAVNRILNHEMTQTIKAAIKETERSLEERKWCLDLKFDKDEDMFKVIKMGASFKSLPNHA